MKKMKVDFELYNVDEMIALCPQCGNSYSSIDKPYISTDGDIRMEYRCESCYGNSETDNIRIKKELVIHYHKGQTSMYWEIDLAE